MNQFRTLLWKECYGQRAGFFGLLLLLPCLPLIALLTGQRDLLEVDLLPGFGAAAGCLAAMFVIGTHLIPGERSGSGLRFLERLPTSLHGVFLAKLTCYLLAVIGFAVYGDVIAQLVLDFTGSKATASFWFESDVLYLILLPTICCALWIFSASVWAPSGALSFPAGIICMALFCWPAKLLVIEHDWYIAESWEPIVFFFVSVSAAVLSGWGAFVFGLRRNGSRGNAALIGLAIAFVCCSPTWAWVGYRWQQVTELDPHDPELVVLSAQVDGSNQTVFVNTAREGYKRKRTGSDFPATAAALHSFRVELSSGEWTKISNEELLRSNHARVIEVEAQLNSVSEHLPPGNRLNEARYGMARLVLNDDYQVTGLFDDSRSRYYDLREYFPKSEHAMLRSVLFRLRVLPDFWLVHNANGFPSLGTGDVWTCLVPETGEWSVAEHLEPEDDVIAILENGTLLVCRNESILRLNPNSGEQIPVEFSGGRLKELKLLFHTQRVPLSVETLSALGQFENIAVFDPVANGFEWIPAGDYEFLKQVDSSQVLIHDKREGLQKLDLRSLERVTVFPPSTSLESKQ